MSKSGLLAQIASAAVGMPFFQAVRALEQALGREVLPADPAEEEALTFTHAPSLAFPPHDIEAVSLDKTVDVALTFAGIVGTASPLSPEWTEETLLSDDEGALLAFYDLFLHRAAAQLFSAWTTHTLEGAFDVYGEDPLSARLRSLAGVDAWASADSDPVPPMVALGLADYHYGQPQTVGHATAEALLRRLFPGFGLSVEPSVQRPVTFVGVERARLGVQNSKLDGNLVYGDTCDDEAGLVRIHVGPVDFDTYEALMPGGGLYVDLERVAARVFGASVDLELEVHVDPSEIPTASLGGARGARLGVDARLVTTEGDALSVRVPLTAGGTSMRRTLVFQDKGG